MTLTAATALLATVLLAQVPERETAFVIFICGSPGAAVDVVMRSEDLIHGMTPLPPGCNWLPFRTVGTIEETVLHIDAPGGRVARISLVIVGNRTGYSSGLVELLS